MGKKYIMGDAILDRTTKEKDLGIAFCADMKVSEQCGIAASKSNQIVGQIGITVTYKGKQLVVPLYKVITVTYKGKQLVVPLYKVITVTYKGKQLVVPLYKVIIVTYKGKQLVVPLYKVITVTYKGKQLVVPLYKVISITNIEAIS